MMRKQKLVSHPCWLRLSALVHGPPNPLGWLTQREPWLQPYREKSVNLEDGCGRDEPGKERAYF